MQQSLEQIKGKWGAPSGRFGSNTTFQIGPDDFQEFANDIADSFVTAPFFFEEDYRYKQYELVRYEYDREGVTMTALIYAKHAMGDEQYNPVPTNDPLTDEHWGYFIAPDHFALWDAVNATVSNLSDLETRVDNLDAMVAGKQDVTGRHGRIITGTVAIGTGSRSTTITTGLVFRTADRIRLESLYGFVEGPVVSYDATTGALSLTSDAYSGSGSLGAGAFVGPGLAAASSSGAAIDDSTGGNSSTTTAWSGSKSSTQSALKLNTGANTGLTGALEVFGSVDTSGQIRRAAATTGSASAAFNRTTGTTTFTTAGTTSSDVAFQVQTPGSTVLIRARGDGVFEVLGAGGNLDFGNSGATITFVTGSAAALSFQSAGTAYLSFVTSAGATSVDVLTRLRLDKGLGYPRIFDQANGAPQVTGNVATIVHSIPLSAAAGGVGRRLWLRAYMNAETADCLRVVVASALLTIIRDTAGNFYAIEGGTTPTVTNTKNAAAAGASGFSVVLNSTTNTVDFVWTGEASQTYNIALNADISPR